MEFHEIEMDLEKLQALEESAWDMIKKLHKSSKTKAERAEFDEYYRREYTKIFKKYKDISESCNLYIDEYEHSRLIDYLKFFVTLINKMEAEGHDEWRKNN